jgi:hypothetical protein
MAETTRQRHARGRSEESEALIDVSELDAPLQLVATPTLEQLTTLGGSR